MKRAHIFAALACALLALSLAGCGAFKGPTDELQSITLEVGSINGVAPGSQSGVVSLQGLGGTIQLKAIGNYTNKKTMDLTNKVTYTVIVDPALGGLLPPCQPPSCPVPSSPPYTSGTLQYDSTGLLTAVEPAQCTWVNSAVDPSTTPAWSYDADYIVTVSYNGITSQPLFVPIASAAGVYDQYSNPTGACGPG